MPDQQFGTARAVPYRRPNTSAASLSFDHSSRRMQTVVCAGCLSLLLALIAFNFVDIDLWHQMGLIRASLSAGHLLMNDPFSYVPTVAPVVDHEWGAGVLAYSLARSMGGTGIVLLKFGAAFGTLLLTIRLAYRRGASAATLGFLAPLAIVLLELGFLPAVRAHAYSFFFTACLLGTFELDRQGVSRRLWTVLLWFPVWINVHAGFVVGLGFVALYGLEQWLQGKAWRHVPVVLCGMIAETFLSPYGTQYFAYLTRALSMARPRIPEWGPVWTLGWGTTALFVLALLVLCYAVLRVSNWRPDGLLLLGGSAIEAALHRKMLPFFAVTWLAYVPAYLEQTPIGRWLQSFVLRRRIFVLGAWSAVIAVCLVAAARQKFWRVEVPQVAGDATYPVGAVDYLAAQQFHGNVMVPFRAGAYVSWKLYPAVKVGLDSRYEVAYPDAWTERVFRFYEGAPGWQETLNAYPTDLVLVPVRASIRTFLSGVGWNEVYRDAQFEVYARPGLQLPVSDRAADSFAGSFP